MLNVPSFSVSTAACEAPSHNTSTLGQSNPEPDVVTFESAGPCVGSSVTSGSAVVVSPGVTVNGFSAWMESSSLHTAFTSCPSSTAASSGTVTSAVKVPPLSVSTVGVSPSWEAVSKYTSALPG